MGIQQMQAAPSPGPSLVHPISGLAGAEESGGGGVRWSEGAEVSWAWAGAVLLFRGEGGSGSRVPCPEPRRSSPGERVGEGRPGRPGPWPGLRALSRPVLPGVPPGWRTPSVVPGQPTPHPPVQAPGRLPWPPLSAAALSEPHTQSHADTISPGPAETRAVVSSG